MKYAHQLLFFLFTVAYIVTSQAQTPGTLKWTFEAGNGIESAPAIADDGTIYLTSVDWNLYALNPDGSEKWFFATGGRITTSPAIGRDGTVYLCSSDNYIYAVHPDGTTKWTYKTEVEFSHPTAAAIDLDGTIYIGSDHTMYAFNPDGNLNWSFKTEGDLTSPTIGYDGTIYFTSSYQYIYALNPDGTIKWTHRISGYVMDTDPKSPIINKDGSIHANGYVLNADGTTLSSGIQSCSAIGSDNVHYRRIQGGVIAINQDKTTQWILSKGYEWEPYSSTPTIGNDGILYIGIRDDNDSIGMSTDFYAIYPDGTEAWVYKTEAWSYQSWAQIASDGTIYTATGDGKFYAFRSSSTGMDMNWPHRRKDQYNRACVHSFSCPTTTNMPDTIYADINQALLDATQCSDPDGDALTYLWRCVEKPKGSTVSIHDSISVTTPVTCSQPGVYRFGITISDNDDGVSAKTFTLICGAKSYATGASVSSSPAVGPDGTIYIASNDGYLYAFYSDLTLKWKYLLNTSDIFKRITSSPAIDSEGTIYIGTEAGKLFAIHPDGTQKWVYDAWLPLYASPAINSEGTIYICDSDGDLIALNPDGTKQWNYLMGGYSDSSPAIGDEGTIYILADNGDLYAIHPDGTKKWAYNIGALDESNYVNNIIERRLSSPAVDFDETIYIGSANGCLYAIHPDGSLKWKTKGPRVHSSPVIGPDSTIYVAYENLEIRAINRSDGTEKWHRYIGNANNELRSLTTLTLTLANDGVLYVGSRDDKLLVLDSNGQEKWSFETKNSIISSPTINQQGILYFGCLDNNVYAIQTESDGLAQSSWPKYRKNLQNTGSSFNPDFPHYPVAVIAEDTIFAKLGTTITLDASQSYDPDGDEISFTWRCIEKQPEKTVTFSDSNTAATEVSFSSVGAFTFELIVSDKKDGVDKTTATVFYGFKTFSTPNEIRSCPAIAENGDIYFNSSNGNIYALQQNGSLKWHYKSSNHYILESLTIGVNGEIHAGMSNYKINIFNPNGTLIKSIDTDDYNNSSPAIAADGTAYYGYGENLLTVDQNSYIKAYAEIDKYSLGSPIIAMDGTIFCGSSSYGTYGGKLCAFNPNGTFKWDGAILKAKAEVSSPSIGSSGVLYLWKGSILAALNPDGSIKWTHSFYDDIGYYNGSSIVVGNEDILYFGLGNNICAMSSEGILLWKYETDKGFGYSTYPAIGDDGTIYIGCYDSKVYAINSDGSMQWTLQTNGSIESSPTIDENGILYIGSNDGNLYMIETTSNSLTDSPWPKYKKDLMNRANAQNSNIPQAIIEEDSAYVDLHSTITLTASSSFDPNNDPINYEWHCADKPVGGQVTITDSSKSTIQATFSVPGYYRMGATVSDEKDGLAGDNIFVSCGIKSFTSQNGIVGSPAIGSDGTVYVTSGDKNLYALDPNLNEKWHYSAQSSIESAPSVDESGTIYFGSWDNNIYSIHPDGTLNWTYNAGNYSASTPSLGEDGTIYTGLSNEIHAIDNSGQKLWSASGAGWNASPVLSKDSTIYIAGGELFSLDIHGKKKWSYNSNYSSDPAIDRLGNLYVGNTYKGLVCLSPVGTELWHSTETEKSYCTPAIDKDGTLYISLLEGKVSAYYPDGTKKWTFQTEYALNISATPTIGSDSTIYIGSWDSNFYALNRDGTVKWIFPTGGEIRGSAAISEDGTLYIGSLDNKIYAIQTDSKGLADSAWPKFKQNNQNQGRSKYYEAPEIPQKPAEIPPLQVVSQTEKSITLIITLPDYSGPIKCDLRYQTHAPGIDTTDWWNKSISVLNTPAPASGKQDTVLISPLLPNSTYYFLLQVRDNESKWSMYSDVAKITTMNTGIQSRIGLPEKFLLYANYPNPFNPKTTIRFDVPQKKHVMLLLYNSTGKKIKEILNQTMNPGYHQYEWDASDYASGIYFIQMKAGSYHKTLKMVLTK